MMSLGDELNNTINELLNNFINSANTDDIFYKFLENLIEMSEASSYSVFFLKKTEFVKTIYKNLREHIEEDEEIIESISSEVYKYWNKLLEEHKIINIKSLNDLPSYAVEEKKLMKETGAKSLIIEGIYLDNELIGCLGLRNNVKEITWKEATIKQLGLAVKLIERDLKRSKKELELSKQNSELREALSQMIQVEKMNSINQLAAGISHEINNPIGFVNSNFQTLQEYFKLILEYLFLLKNKRDEVEEFEMKNDLEFIFEDIGTLFEETEEGIQRVIRIIRNLKIFSRIDTETSLTEYNVNTGIKSIVKILKGSVKIEKKLESTNVLNCKDSIINLAIFNIIKNALDSVEGIESNLDKSVKIETFDENSNVIIKISDNGVGISDINIEKIFEPFFTTKKLGEGPGLGLYISYDIIVNKYKGTISVESGEGKGAIFTIKLPTIIKE